MRSCIELDLDEHRFLPVHQTDQALFLRLLSTAEPNPEFKALRNHSSSHSRLIPIRLKRRHNDGSQPL